MIDNSSFENTSELDSTTMKADQRHSLEGMMGMGVASTFHAILMQSSPKIFQVKFFFEHTQQLQCSLKISSWVCSLCNIMGEKYSVHVTSHNFDANLQR